MDYIPGGELFTYLRTEGKLTSDHSMYVFQIIKAKGFTELKYA